MCVVGVMSEYIGTDSEFRSMPAERKIHPRGVPSTAEDNAAPHKGLIKLLKANYLEIIFYQLVLEILL